MNISTRLLLVAALTTTVGCASMPDSYVPKTVGPIQGHDAWQDLALEIDTPADAVRRGDLVTFTVRLRNQSDEAIWLPANPDLRFVWTYPNGRRDNFLHDPPQSSYYDETSATRLDPGQELVRNMNIKTYYFDFNGVTEFRAVLEVANNINPNLRPFWSGKLVSNGYGVLVGDRQQVAQHSARAERTLRDPS